MKFELLETYLRLSETKPFQEQGSENDGPYGSSETLSSYGAAELTTAYPEIGEIVVSSERAAHESSNYRKKRKLAQGGMGLVYEAEQLSLKRDVVIKEIYQDDRAELLSHRLIHEARLAGKLEHPNVAPVYELGQTKDGRPVLVMKRIDGTSWKALLHDPEHAFWNKVTGDRLVWNLNVLIQICNAVAYAHDKGIVHRDIKPENIMLGQYGEVYLLDWGLAFDTTKPVGPLVPLAAGTPAYMAPEMLRGIHEVDFRTDVYLLGAVLYELLVGYGPHKADSASEAIQKILVDREFTFPKELSKTIVSICKKAISFDKEARFQSVSALRQKIQEHLSQRNSDQLAEEAVLKQRELEGLLEALRQDPESHSIYEQCTKIYMAAKMGINLALEQWSENPTAISTRTEVTKTMIRIELERNALDQAKVFLSELQVPAPELEKEIEKLSKTQKIEIARRNALESFAAEQDTRVGAKERSLFFRILIFVAFAMQIVFIIKNELQLSSITTAEILFSFLLVLAVICPIAYKFRKSLWANKRSQTVTNSVASFLVLILAFRTTGFLQSSSVISTVSSEIMMGIGFFTLYATSLFPRAWWCVGFGLLSLGLLELFPSFLEVIFGNYLLGIIVINYLIATSEIEGASQQDRR